MNCLAHLYLSGEDPDLKMGNFMADHIKGKAINDLPESVRKGVILHRKIDQFTDNHPVVELSKISLRPQFRKYAPVITDIFYDHFLAKNWNQYASVSLPIYAEEFYKLSSYYTAIMPQRTTHMLRYMIANNWLVSYGTLDGIHSVLTGMSKRTAFHSGMEHAAEFLQGRYPEFEEEFSLFFEELTKYVSDVMREEIKVTTP